MVPAREATASGGEPGMPKSPRVTRADPSASGKSQAPRHSQDPAVLPPPLREPPAPRLAPRTACRGLAVCPGCRRVPSPRECLDLRDRVCVGVPGQVLGCRRGPAETFALVLHRINKALSLGRRLISRGPETSARPGGPRVPRGSPGCPELSARRCGGVPRVPGSVAHSRDRRGCPPRGRRCRPRPAPLAAEAPRQGGGAGVGAGPVRGRCRCSAGAGGDTGLGAGGDAGLGARCAALAVPGRAAGRAGGRRHGADAGAAR